MLDLKHNKFQLSLPQFWFTDDGKISINSDVSSSLRKGESGFNVSIIVGEQLLLFKLLQLTRCGGEEEFDDDRTEFELAHELLCPFESTKVKLGGRLIEPVSLTDVGAE